MKRSMIYTGTGDDGTTSLVGGTRVSKDSLRLDGYGTIDELNCHLGMVRSYPIDNEDKDFIVFLQNKLFSVGGHLATDSSVTALKSATIITPQDVELIEKEMDRLDEKLPPLRHFVLPGGHPQVSACHIARTVCRRAERIIISLNRESKIDPVLLVFVNRVSDYLFILSRKISQDVKIEEIHWQHA